MPYSEPDAVKPRRFGGRERRAQRHRGASEDGRQQRAEHRLEHAGGKPDAERAVSECAIAFALRNTMPAR